MHLITISVMFYVEWATNKTTLILSLCMTSDMDHVVVHRYLPVHQRAYVLLFYCVYTHTFERASCEHSSYSHVSVRARSLLSKSTLSSIQNNAKAWMLIHSSSSV